MFQVHFKRRLAGRCAGRLRVDEQLRCRGTLRVGGQLRCRGTLARDAANFPQRASCDVR